MPEKYTEEHIRSLNWDEHVRLHPHMYFESCFKEGTLDDLPLEAACHAMDEYFDGNCDRIEIRLEREGFTISYDAGMQLKQKDELYYAEAILLIMRTCHNLKKHLEVGDEFCRIGIAVINATTKLSELTTVSDGKKGIFRCDEGRITRRDVHLSNEKEHTQLFMQPDPAVFGDLKLTFEGVKQKAEALMRRLPGLTIVVTQSH